MWDLDGLSSLSLPYHAEGTAGGWVDNTCQDQYCLACSFSLTESNLTLYGNSICNIAMAIQYQHNFYLASYVDPDHKAASPDESHGYPLLMLPFDSTTDISS